MFCVQLAGMHLEQEVDSASMDQLEELLIQAQASPNLKPNMATLAKSVVNLRHQTWGRSPPSPAQPQWSSDDGAAHQSNHFSVSLQLNFSKASTLNYPFLERACLLRPRWTNPDGRRKQIPPRRPKYRRQSWVSFFFIC